MNQQGASDWPALPLKEWQETYATLHLWTQIVGKVRLVLSEWVNHYWHITLYVTPRGLSTPPIPHGYRIFQIDFDFIDHELVIRVSDGKSGRLKLQAQSVATIYKALMAELERLELPVKIWTMPCKLLTRYRLKRMSGTPPMLRTLPIDSGVSCSRLTVYLNASAPISSASAVQSNSTGGAADLAMTRFSGKPAPPHPGGVPNLPNYFSLESYSHEQSSCGFWPGSGPIPYPAFYAYAYPEPDGLSEVAVSPAEAFYSQELGEFILPYDSVREASEPDSKLVAFLQSTYEATARLGEWDREALERKS